MKIEHRPIGSVRPYERNPRSISDKAVAKVAASIRDFGFQQPIVVDRAGVIIVGHTRLRAAQRLGLDTVPVVVAADLSEAQARAYRIADNRVGEETDWDDERLAAELRELDAAAFELSATGLDDAELNRLLRAEAGEGGGGRGAHAVSRQGETWYLGPHRLMVGSQDEPAADSIVEAWQRRAFAEATLDAPDGPTFAQVKAERAAAA